MPTEGRQKLLPWLKRILDKNLIKGVEWINVDKGTFKILWPHKLNTYWAKENAVVFKEWARQAGRYIEGVTPEDYSTWKGNLRSALRSCPFFEYLGYGDQETSDDKNNLPYRIYRMKSSEVQKLAASSPAFVEGVGLETGNTMSGSNNITPADDGLKEISMSISSLKLEGDNKLSFGEVAMNSETGELEDFAGLFPHDQPAPHDVAGISVTVNSEADVTCIPLQVALIGETYQEQPLQLLMQQTEAGTLNLFQAGGYPPANIQPGLTDSLDLNCELNSAEMQSADIEYFDDLLDVAAKQI